MIDNTPGLQRKVEELRRRKDEAKGAYKSLIERLKKEFGVDSLKALKRLLPKLEEDERQAARVWTRAKKKFERKHKKVLEEDDA